MVVRTEKIDVAERFIDEKLAEHWKVGPAKESFDRLMRHLEENTNIRRFFELAMEACLKDIGEKDGLVVADIGSGVSWTSAILAKRPEVRSVYAVDPSKNRLKHAEYVIKHFGVSEKVVIQKGTFSEPNIPGHVDIVVLCGSLHHCYENNIDELFGSIKRLLKPGGRVLIAVEHFVDWKWAVKRGLGYFRHFGNKQLGYSLKRIYAPHPVSGDHWRTRRKLERMFASHAFSARFTVHKEGLNKVKSSWYFRYGCHYYYALLTNSDQR